MTKSDSIHWRVFYLAFISFLISCYCLVFETLNIDGDYELQCPGWHALLVGWMGILGAQFAWFANPLMFATGVLLHRRKYDAALVAASVAALCSLCTFIWYQPFPTGKLPEEVLLPGAWFWFAAVGCVWLSALIAWHNADDCASEGQSVGEGDSSQNEPVPKSVPRELSSAPPDPLKTSTETMR